MRLRIAGRRSALHEGFAFWDAVECELFSCFQDVRSRRRLHVTVGSVLGVLLCSPFFDSG